jgi:hypothetical protein
MKYLHRFNLVAILTISTIWACLAFNTNPFYLIYSFQFIELLKITYILGFTVVFWAIFYLEICDLIYTALGKNGRVYSKYFSTIKKELATTLISALVLMSIYWGDSVKYDFSGIDLGFVGGPFIVISIISIFQMMKTKVAGKPVRKSVLFIILALILIFSVISYNYLQKNSSGDYETYQALWFQLTILFASFWFYLSTNWQLYFLTSSKIELSKFKLYFMKEVCWIKSNQPELINKLTKGLNKQNIIAKAKYSAKIRKKK